MCAAVAGGGDSSRRSPARSGAVLQPTHSRRPEKQAATHTHTLNDLIVIWIILTLISMTRRTVCVCVWCVPSAAGQQVWPRRVCVAVSPGLLCVGAGSASTPTGRSQQGSSPDGPLKHTHTHTMIHSTTRC